MIGGSIRGFVDAFENLVDGVGVANPEESIEPLESEWKDIYVNRPSLADLTR